MSGSLSVNFQEEMLTHDDDLLEKQSPYEHYYQRERSLSSSCSSSCSSSNDTIDQSRFHDSERVVEISPNERYARLNLVLGKGAYKVVYKAIDREEGYEVAWNTMQATRSIDCNEMEHEISILKSVRHPNIIAFHDAWCLNNEFVFVTEWMTSGTLREYIRKLNSPNVKIIKRWSRQILKGLAYLHNHEPAIIHRDLKCDNIFINGSNGEVKIGDMGTAEMKQGKKYTIIGTPEFMAPEMYEENGYSEKVDIYAFGMCLLEMSTGDYPYSECTNACQIYKKVSSGIKPAGLAKVQHDEIRSIIENCLGDENERMSAQEILEGTFFAVEPDVTLLFADPSQIYLTLQVTFKGVDKHFVKFDFNVETDTAEQVVREMIEEQVLPEQYQQHITKEINCIIRNLHQSDSNDTAIRESVWRRENDIRSELERTREELDRATEHVQEIESKCDRAITAERQYLEAIHELYKPGLKIDITKHPETSIAVLTENEPTFKKSECESLPLACREALVSQILEEYTNDTDIEVFVRDCAIASHRNTDKAIEWANKLKDQDIMTVGDLRDLHDEDWAGIGLTVFALRALKNRLQK